MQLLNSIISTLAVAALAYADCSSLGGSDSFSGSFRLAAYDATAGTTTTLTLANSLTVPMTSFYVLSASGGTNNGFVNLTLSSGIISSQSSISTLAPIHSLGAVEVSEQNPVPASGPFLTWSNTFAAPSEVFCAVPSSTPDAGDLLAAYGHTDLFFLCESFFALGSPQTFNALLYNASTTFVPDSTPGYEGSTCKPVTVLFEPL